MDPSNSNFKKKLPQINVITHCHAMTTKQFLLRLELLLNRGLRLFQIRAKNLDNAAYAVLANEAVKLGRQFGAIILLNRSIKIVREIDADGIHLNSHTLLSQQKRPLNHSKFVSAACHNVLELHHAEKIGADFVMLSPVLPTRSHPSAPYLGWRDFSAMIQETTIPVFALGGVNENHLATAKAHGGYGLSGISGFWEIVIN